MCVYFVFPRQRECLCFELSISASMLGESQWVLWMSLSDFTCTQYSDTVTQKCVTQKCEVLCLDGWNS